MFTWDLGQPFDRTETGLLRLVIGLILLVVIYSVLSGFLARQMKRKKAEAEQSISDTNHNQITLARTDNEKN